MEFVIKHFNELSTKELYEILKTRFEILVTEQECIYQDLDDKDQDAIQYFAGMMPAELQGVSESFEKIMTRQQV